MIALAERLPRDRFEIEFVLLTHAGTSAPAAEAAGATVRVIGWTRRAGRLHALRWPLDVLRLGLALRKGHYDIVDAWLFHAYGLAALTRPISRVPVLISGRRFMTDGQPRFGRVERLLDSLARRSSDSIVAVSEAVRDDVVEHEDVDPSRLRVVRMGVLIPEPMSSDERNAIRAAWGFGPSDLVVGSVANYKPRKGLELLIRVVARLRTEQPNLRLVLVGEGTHRPVIESLVSELELGDVVRVHGRENDARRLYGAFDIFAHASETEGASNAVFEAAAAARAIVATRTGGIPEMVQHDQTGLLVPVGDIDGFARELLALAEDPALRERLGAAARARAVAVFGMDRMIAEFAALYEELAERKGVRR
jgi:glycosyltransferase involved in cell wall biosynthesis